MRNNTLGRNRLRQRYPASRGLLPAILFWFGMANGPWRASQAGAIDELRLVPFPKEVIVRSGRFPLRSIRAIEAHASCPAVMTAHLRDELRLAGLDLSPALADGAMSNTVRLLSRKAPGASALEFRPEATAEDYTLEVASDSVTVRACGAAGLAHGVQTLRQLIRANRVDDTLPCLAIRDWPSLRWRAFQDDLTRGPSTTLENLKLEVELGALLKLNVFTYYMEYQFTFAKHPIIGPPDGSFTAPELKELVGFARPIGVNVLGNQQSFGHFTAILAHQEYAPLRETPYLLCPTNEDTYALLDDLYSEVMPALEFPYFNVCCDETDGLGQGPSKPVADQIGLGSLYVRHIQRLHSLVTDKHGKRMMMWGDIILRHPDQIGKAPKNVIMLTWGYEPRQSFEDQIIPFARSGHEFWVCPGVSCWSRVLPDFPAAVTNIQNFVRDGARLGAVGMLNTAWDDDGESFNAPNWHGFAWGAECAWNAANTPYTAFNRRLGAVLFGERTDHFGRAIDLLSTPGIRGMPNREFWKPALDPIKLERADRTIEHCRRVLHTVRLAIEELGVCQREASANGALLDYFIFGARRIEAHAESQLDHLEAAIAYRSADGAPAVEQTRLIERAEGALRRARRTHLGIRTRFVELWDRENKPYARDWTVRRYDDALANYDRLLERLSDAKTAIGLGRPLPKPIEIGLELIETG